MRIGIIGGLERIESALEQVAARHGHELEFQRGRTTGRKGLEIESIASRVSLLVIVVEVNSHGAVLLGRLHARKHGTRVVFLRKCGVASLGALLESLDRERAAA